MFSFSVKFIDLTLQDQPLQSQVQGVQEDSQRLQTTNADGKTCEITGRAGEVVNASVQLPDFCEGALASLEAPHQVTTDIGCNCNNIKIIEICSTGVHGIG